MAGEIVMVLGAGATKACDGPLTNEILPWAFAHAGEIEREGYIDLAARFITQVFGVDPRNPAVPPERLPSLTLILSLIDLALDRREAIDARWQALNPVDPSSDLGHVRHAFDYLIFAVLERHLTRITSNPHVQLLTQVRNVVGDACVISLNYDIIADNSFVRMGEDFGTKGFPDYGTDIASDFYRERDRVGRLLKLHGSLNWLYCPNCHRLDLGLSESGRYTAKVLDELWSVRRAEQTLEHRYTCHGSPCVDCGTWVRPVLISPSFQKDYRNPHIAAIWRQADAMLRKAKRIIFVGYSLPEDDIHVVYLLKRAAGHLRNGDVTVVEYDAAQMRVAHAHPVGRRYMWLFGDGIDWHPEGFSPWIETATI
jgi:hypothetical protein